MVLTPLHSQENEIKKRVETEKSTAPFSLTQFNKQVNSHYVLTTNVNNGQIVIDQTSSIKEVGGKLPYPSGNFSISVLDNQGKVLSDYVMPDPLIIRSCDEGDDHIKLLDKGVIFISLPKNEEISNIRFSRNKKRVGEIKIDSLMARFLDRDEKKE